MWVELIAAAAVATGLASCPDTQVVNPEWLDKPTGDDIAWAYPPDAADKGLSGLATIHCEVTFDGLPENCIVVGEEPRGQGFGEAALMLSKFMRFSPQTICGAKVRSNVRIPINFQPPDGMLKVAVSPENLALAHRLIVAMGMDQAINDRFERELQVAYGAYEGDSKLSVDHRRAAFLAAKETWATVKDHVLEPVAKAYAARLTTDELKQAVDFYESPVGESLAMQQRRVIVVADKPIVTPELVEDFRKRYCERVLPCGPEPIGEKR